MSDLTPQPSAQPTHPDDQQPLSLEQARRVIWQAQPKVPMGELLDQGKLTRKDLEWAISKAYRADVRRAARRLLQELDQPMVPAPASFARAGSSVAQPRHGARVVFGSGYLEEQQDNHLASLGAVVGVVVMVFLYSLIDAARSLLAGRPVNVLAIVGFIVSMLLGMWYVRRHARAWRSYRIGRKGEEQVVEQLRTALDHRWTIYRNLQLPKRKDDLDQVLVGPGGIWAVQVKTFSMPLRCSNNVWEYRRGRRWIRCDAKYDPATQVTRQATMLHDFLARNGIDRFVERAIALAEAVPAADVATSPIPVWLPFNIAERTAVLATRHPPSNDELARINDLLERRAGEQRAVEAAEKVRQQ
jgi:hypothetical protein